jgi:hypothetical protein
MPNLSAVGVHRVPRNEYEDVHPELVWCPANTMHNVGSSFWTSRQRRASRIHYFNFELASTWILVCTR